MREKIAEMYCWDAFEVKIDIASPFAVEESFIFADKILALFAEREKILQTLLKDTTDDDTAIRELARKVLPDEMVDGDSYGVPTIVDIVEWLVNKIEQMGGCRNEKERDRTV